MKICTTQGIWIYWRDDAWKWQYELQLFEFEMMEFSSSDLLPIIIVEKKKEKKEKEFLNKLYNIRVIMKLISVIGTR